MKKLIFTLVFVGFQAHAADYLCSAAANPNRGFETAFQVQISPDQNGGDVSIITIAKSKVGTVSRVVTLSDNDEATHDAFQLTLNLIAEKDVSGLDNPSTVSSIQAIEVSLATPGDHELKLFKLFDKTGKQIGGTILADMHGDACVPTSN